MNPQHSDAFVFFGATGDLATKKIFPSLHAMVKRGHLNVPVVGVARFRQGPRRAPGPGPRQLREVRGAPSRGFRDAERPDALRER